MRRNKNSRVTDAAYDEILREWQNGIYRINLYIILITLCIEIIFMFILNARGTISVPIPQYIPLYIMRPTLINIAAFTTCVLLNHRGKISHSIRAMLPLVLLTVVVSNLIVVHYVFTALYATIIVPIYVSSIYGNTKITRRLFYLLMPVYVFDMICILITPGRNLPSEFPYDVLVAFCMIPLSYLLVKNIVEYENKKEQLIMKRSIENDKLREEIKVDGLTEIYNHTGLFEYMDAKIDEYEEGKQLMISVIDIDFFKRVNDDFGHETGNVVLKALANMMQTAADEVPGNEDGQKVLAARYGGEEFSLVFSDMEMNEAVAILKKIHEQFGKQSFPGINRKVTFSAGIAKYEHGMTDQMFFEKADQALYRAKNEGRNRIIVAE